MTTTTRTLSRRYYRKRLWKITCTITGTRWCKFYPPKQHQLAVGARSPRGRNQGQTMTLTIRGKQLLENGTPIADTRWNCTRAIKPAEFRAHWLAQTAFGDGIDAANALVAGFDRTGLPDDAIKVASSGCAPGYKLTINQALLNASRELSADEWRTFNARDDADLFWAFDTLHCDGKILKAMRPESPQYWFRLVDADTVRKAFDRDYKTDDHDTPKRSRTVPTILHDGWAKTFRSRA